jgi:threonine dehydratase
MSIESLKADLSANLQTLVALDPATATAGDLVKHLKETLWPFLESVVDETAEVDDCVADLISGAEDIMQPETAEVFAAVVAGAVAVAGALRKFITPETEPQLWKVVDELEKNCKSAETIMAEIVIDTGDDEDEDEEIDDGDDADDEGDDQ